MTHLEFLKHLFLPHHTNNHKAKILHPSGITFVIIALLIIESSLSVFSKMRPDILGFAADISVPKLLEDTNKKRLDNGLPPLVMNDELSQAAAGKAADMFGNNYWAHVSPSGKTPWDFIVGAGYSYIYAGENLAKDFQDSQGVVDAWMNSPSHRENLLQPKFQEIGFAVVNGRLNGEETTLVVQMFGTRNAVTSSSSSPSAPANNQPAVGNAAPVASAPVEAAPEIPAPVISPVQTAEKVKYRPEVLNIKPQLNNADVVERPKPKYDLLSLSKKLMTGTALVLIIILGIDAIVVSRKKIVRISGSSFAHLLFLTTLLAAVWLIGRGSVI